MVRTAERGGAVAEESAEDQVTALAAEQQENSRLDSPRLTSRSRASRGSTTGRANRGNYFSSSSQCQFVCVCRLIATATCAANLALFSSRAMFASSERPW